MVDVEACELLCHIDSCVVVRYQVFMSDFVLPANLVNDEFRITVRVEMLDTNLFCKLHSDRQSIVYRNVIGTWLS